MIKKILIFGKGFLGNRIAKSLDNTFLTEKRVSGDRAKLEDYLSEMYPDIVINAIGKTHGPGVPSIDWCEKNKKETMRSNVLAVYYLAEACARRGIYFVHLGSGCIYNGNNDGKGFSETDEPNFGLNREQFYATTKIQAERALKRLSKKYPDFKYLVLRLRMPIDDMPNERNLITKLLGYKELIDVPNSMTVVPHMIPTMKELMEKEKTGIFNLVNPGVISAADIMRLYKNLVDPSHEFDVISLMKLEQDLVQAKRSNCYLNTDKLKLSGIVLPDIRNGVIGCLTRYSKVS